jgi:hypothetical protein
VARIFIFIPHDEGDSTLRVCDSHVAGPRVRSEQLHHPKVCFSAARLTLWGRVGLSKAASLAPWMGPDPHGATLSDFGCLYTVIDRRHRRMASDGALVTVPLGSGGGIFRRLRSPSYLLTPILEMGVYGLDDYAEISTDENGQGNSKHPRSRFFRGWVSPKKDRSSRFSQAAASPASRAPRWLRGPFDTVLTSTKLTGNPQPRIRPTTHQRTYPLRVFGL